MSKNRSIDSLAIAVAIVGLQLFVALAPAAAQLEETFTGPPDATALTPHVVFPNLGTIPWPLDCSQWPETVPNGGYLASVFGHRDHNGGPDFHRGMDLRCDADGHTCCDDGNGNVQCGATTCPAGQTEVAGAPIYALFDGVVKTVHSGSNNNLVVETTRAAADIEVGGTESCDKIYTWYQHLRTNYADKPGTTDEWAVGDAVSQGDLLGWQGRSGADSVHLHLSTRVCRNSRADGTPDLDPEMNPFQLIGSDNGNAPEVKSLTTEISGTDLVVTVEIETDDPDFDKLEVTVYDAPNDTSHVRRLGYNSRLGIDVDGNNIDTYVLDPDGDSEITALVEPDPPVATSGLTLAATFVGLDLASDPDSLVQVKVADVFGNTTVREQQIFGDAEIGDVAWDDLDGNRLQDPSEPGLAGVGIDLYRADGTYLASTVSDAQGAYSFTGLIAGDYYLAVQPPPGYGATQQIEDYEDLDSNVNPQTLQTGTIELSASEIDRSVDAGFTSTCFDVDLVGYNSEWKTSGTYTSGWESPSFGDSGWSSLQGPLGWGNGLVYSTIPNSGFAAYFRLELEIEDVTLFDTFDLEMLLDDGAIVYLNGVEVMRSNMPSGAVDDTTPASSHSTATVSANLPASYLLPDTNVLAVEVHNRTATSDLVFDLRLSSSVCRPCLSEVTLPADAGTYLKAGSSTIRGSEDTIEIDGSTERNGLMSWDLSALPVDADVLHAELIVEVTDKSSSDFQIFALNRDWDEAAANWYNASGSPTVTWETAGAHGASDRGTVPLGLISLDEEPPVTGTVVLNVGGRGVINDWIDGTTDNRGIIAHGDASESNGLDIQSGDGGTVAPKLRLVYASACGI